MPPQSSVAIGEVPTPTPLTPADPSQGDHPFPATTVPTGGPNPPDPPQRSTPMGEDPTPAPLTPVDPPQGDHPLPATTVPTGGPSTLPMPPQDSVPMDEDPTPTPLTPANPLQGEHPLPATTNSEALALLSLNFYEKLKGSSYHNVTFCEKDMNLAALRKLCEQKSARAHQAHQKQAVDAKRRREDRMTPCRHGTLARRIKIAVQNRSRDPKKWDVIQKITQQLDIKGMSGDEIDYVLGTNKVVRCIELPWISPVISNLFKSVKSYQSAF
ncbi:hypothetical protein PAXRUDRAFT_20089 [Paxillus rubicundulus Ve08.2h10]|uniref:Uncharacterized protein n=1 Tax=Paxillus rubicundulus Ve08.2h10 TaxID=930991 RepID=A0A0D0BRX1_9AGAM|nr:hypothetical protein PAXRUDRAFT_20089 [Paxillus rubicundulus Ve08.2h10]